MPSDNGQEQATTSKEVSLENAKALLISGRRLDRERGAAMLQQVLGVEGADGDATPSNTVFPSTGPVVAGCSSEVLAAAEAMSLALTAEAASWETVHGGLLAGALVVRTQRTSPGFVEAFARLVTDALSCKESRVRVEAGVTLGVCVSIAGLDIYRDIAGPVILKHVEENLQRQQSTVDEADPVLIEKLGKEDVFHESAGWKTLETGTRALHEVIKASGPAFAPFLDHHLLNILFVALTHTNRFVRETGYYVCSELCGVLEPQLAKLGDAASGAPDAAADGAASSTTADGAVPMATEEDTAAAAAVVTPEGAAFAQPESASALVTADEFVGRMSGQLAVGLGDNWSQVRMAASVAARRFLLAVPPARRESFFELLLPRMCLNRYYVAEGVRLYSQETWRSIVGDQGTTLVARYIDATISYYVAQTRADNHAVREAACACIAELGAKVQTPAMERHIPELLQALIEAFRDHSWPVRDAACIASGRFIRCYPAQAADRMDEFYELFFQHIGDNIWSVRENAAIALGLVVEAFGQDAFAKVAEKIKEFLPAAKTQPEISQKHPGLENVTQFGVARPVSPSFDLDGGPKRIKYRAGQTEDPEHSNQQLYSCGSLAPKLGRGGGGCSNHGYKRPVEPWELTDGCIYLLREVAGGHPTEVTSFLKELSDVARLKHYQHHFTLLETLWKQLPAIATAIGKRNFKRVDRDFVEPLAYTLECSNHLAKTAAELCVQALAKYLGPNIFLGHVAEVNDRLVPVVERALHSLPPHAPLVDAVNPSKSFVPPEGRIVPSFGPPGMSAAAHINAAAHPAMSVAAASGGGPRGPVRLV